MIQFRCGVEGTALFTDLIPFQGQLKQRNAADIKKLAQSLTDDGLLTPFVVWQDGEKLYLLDGHARREAVVQLAFEDPKLLTERFPVVTVKAESIDEARELLLQVTSQYGKITPKGLAEFMAHCPKVDLGKCSLRVKLPEAKVAKVPSPRSLDRGVEVGADGLLPEPKVQKEVIRLRIDKDKVSQVIEVLKGISFVEVLK